MNVTYDPHTDTLSIVLAPREVAESDEDKPGVILDYDAASAQCPPGPDGSV